MSRPTGLLNHGNRLAKTLNKQYPNTPDAMLVLVTALTALLVSLDDENLTIGLREVRSCLDQAERFRSPRH